MWRRPSEGLVYCTGLHQWVLSASFVCEVIDQWPGEFYHCGDEGTSGPEVEQPRWHCLGYSQEVLASLADRLFKINERKKGCARGGL